MPLVPKTRNNVKLYNSDTLTMLKELNNNSVDLKPNLYRFFRFTCNDKYSQKSIDKFISKIDTTPGLGPKGDCWERNKRIRRGYGRFRYNNKIYSSHKVAWELSHNKLVPCNKLICHTCDNRKCCNPMHLFLGTNQDNMTDMVNKKRQNKLKNENNGMAKLTWIQVKEIRNLYTTGKYTMKQLANKFGVTQSCIGNIIRNKLWYDPNYIRTKLDNIGNTQIDENTKNKIYILYIQNKYGYGKLAKQFNISPSRIRDIVKNN